jgi:signal transduction histidine kinase
MIAVEPTVSREVYLYLNKTAPVLFFVLNSAGRIVEANRYAEAITGRSLIGKQFTDLIIDFTGTFDPAVFTSDTSREHLLNIATHSGLPQSYYFSFKPANDQILTFGRLDTEEIENIRKEVQILNQELNNLTRQLHKTNAQLRQLNELKTQFLGMAAHDLRNPVSAILNYTEFLIDEAGKNLTTEQAGFLQTIHTSTTLMHRLIDDFLDVSLIESGRFYVDLVKTDIREPVDRSVTLNRLLAQKRGIALRVEYDGTIPVILMDGFKIEQVLNNLVSNAIQHSPPNTEVVIRVSRSDKGVMAAIMDAGPGIAPDEMERLFTPYARGRARKAAGTRSTGLGLSISKKIIEAHNGNIWVESKPGDGATFCFMLPIAIESNEEQHK